MPRWRALPLVGLALLLVSLTALPVSPAEAITRKEANRVALRALRPEREPGRVILFGLRRPLGPRSVVLEAGSPGAGGGLDPVPARPLRRRAWLFWEDRVAGALFKHPSTLLLVDDRTGRVRLRQELGWYPLVDFRRPPFLRSPAAYHGSRFQVFSNVRRPAGGRGPSPFPAPLRARPRARRADRYFATKPEQFAKECLIIVGDRQDRMFKGNYSALKKFAGDVGLSAGDAESSLAGLRRAVDDAVRKGDCRNVFLYLAGHGVPEAEGAAGVEVALKPVFRQGAGGQEFVGLERERITPADLAQLMRDYLDVAFTIKIDSCYAGRFVDPLRASENLRVLEVSSGAKEPSYGWLPWNKRGDTTVREQDHNPTRATEFTNGNVMGLYEWAGSPGEQRFTGRSLALGGARSHDLGRAWDFARADGLTHPEAYERKVRGGPLERIPE